MLTPATAISRTISILKVHSRLKAFCLSIPVSSKNDTYVLFAPGTVSLSVDRVVNNTLSHITMSTYCSIALTLPVDPNKHGSTGKVKEIEQSV